MNQDTLLEEFQRDVVPLLKKRYNPERIIIFGSYATNTTLKFNEAPVPVPDVQNKKQDC